MDPSANQGVGGTKLLWKDKNAERFEVEFNQAWAKAGEGNRKHMNWGNLKRAILVAAEEAEMEKIKERNGRNKGWFDEECKNKKKKGLE